MKEPKFPEFAIFDATFEAMRKRLYFEHWRNADLKEKMGYMQAKIEELKRELASGGDTTRLDFVIDNATSWYPGRGPDGQGILCWGLKRKETLGKTMRDAIDAAKQECRS